MEEKEEWRQTEFEKYFISNCGNLRKELASGEWKYLKGHINNQGYRWFCITVNKKQKTIMNHTLVAYAFIGERPEGLVIDHIDRNRLNNHVSNLRYITSQENRINSKDYRDDILETDKIKRRNILKMEAYYRRTEGLLERKKEGGIRKVRNAYLARITINKKRISKCFKTIEEAEEYLKDIVANK